jgi:DNA repair exonuclease SbcCD ATPase subunit
MTKPNTQTAPAPKSAAQKLADLREREATLNTELSAASLAGDADLIIALTREYDELPIRIRAARLASLRERIDTLEPRAVEASRVSTVKAEATEVLRLELESVTARYNEALQASFFASSTHQSLFADLSAARREIEDLARANPNAHAAPIVRSKIHAAR